jgi:hypothetical protein
MQVRVSGRNSLAQREALGGRVFLNGSPVGAKFCEPSAVRAVTDNHSAAD